MMEKLLNFTPDFMNWRNYRTLMNDKVAVISANLELQSEYKIGSAPILAQCTLSYQADENGLPVESEQERVFSHILKLLVQASALSNVHYAGHILSDGKAIQYFYLANKMAFLDVATQLLSAENVSFQQDPTWDLFSDFLLPSPLEMKFCLTEDLLDNMLSDGNDLSQIYTIEHRLHFDEREEMDHFIEKFSLANLTFVNIRYSDRKIQLEDMDLEQYLVKIEQEMPLDSQEIFLTLEQIDKLLNDCNGEYLGWEVQNLNEQKNYLN